MISIIIIIIILGEGLLDHCTIFKATATVINLADIIPSSISWSNSHAIENNNISTEEEEEECKKEPFEQITITTNDNIIDLVDIDNDDIDTRCEETSTITLEKKNSNNNNNNNTTTTTTNNNNNNNNKDDHSSSVVEVKSTINNSNRYPGYRPSSSSSSSSSYNNNIRGSDESDLPAICIELVGSRFLRRMVRILTVRRRRRYENNNILVV